MILFQFPSAIFPDNAISRAELSYQARSRKKLSPWRRWVNSAVMWLALAIALVEYIGLWGASLLQRDPAALTHALNPLPTLLVLFAFFYHFYLMFQTIALTANSIAREKEAQTWEMLVLTGINARQIVRGKWWASIQRQLPAYLRLGMLRAGAMAALAIGLSSLYNYSGGYYARQLQLPHPITVVVVGIFGVALPVANLALSAACGVMGSAASKRSTFAIARGFAIQIVITLVPVLIIAVSISRLYTVTVGPVLRSIYSALGLAIISLVDNGVIMLTFPIRLDYNYNSGAHSAPYTTTNAPLTFDWMVAGLLVLIFYGLLIRFALWRAEKRAVRALASPVS